MKPALSRLETSRSNTGGPRTKPIDSLPWLPILCVKELMSSPRQAAPRRCARQKQPRQRFLSYSAWARIRSRWGFVDSLNRPGGNVTGVTFLANELEAKQLD